MHFFLLRCRSCLQIMWPHIFCRYNKDIVNWCILLQVRKLQYWYLERIFLHSILFFFSENLYYLHTKEFITCCCYFVWCQEAIDVRYLQPIFFTHTNMSLLAMKHHIYIFCIYITYAYINAIHCIDVLKNLGLNIFQSFRRHRSAIVSVLQMIYDPKLNFGRNCKTLWNKSGFLVPRL